ncbi:ABC-2 transporter permease [Clostridium botulinum]|uniref:ABC-2 transporter permease n=1 Tax=Clostridium botulinum C/D str. DC5 TaxID=1443128 RepID=A0A0A0IKG9_CLOBO|nr:ABC-2 transporter permease [Clostridium botulinum]KEI04027.1 hypothetical protein Z952_07505 [Clostridium botulinum C/D str. BKT75002]KEI10116.1 hypothetical protein Z954_10380 [Clostridium botulinum C/D str. BKT2873]KGM98351.1 hypothetical protein Z956_00175 [Clostridium botulinum D str. CCUG 7971]KGN00066.1 hypothetical protein Z955_04905 [Clostridium botulinum C/D str. DC5]KOC50897.1 hypothetical protein ADU88_01025 [Clostridium botulinum]
MKNLILKDIIIAKKSFWIGMIINAIFFMSWGYYGKLSIFINTICIIIFIFMYVEGSNVYDDLYKSYMIIASLPIKRSDIVKTKYIQVPIYLVIGEVEMIMIYFIMKYFKIYEYNPLCINFKIILINIVGILIYYAVYYPIYFKVGSRYTKNINSSIFMIVVLLPTIILKTLKKHPNVDIVKSLRLLTNYKGILIVLLGAILMFIVSFKTSQRIYIKRDLQ